MATLAPFEQPRATAEAFFGGSARLGDIA